AADAAVRPDRARRRARAVLRGAPARGGVLPGAVRRLRADRRRRGDVVHDARDARAGRRARGRRGDRLGAGQRVGADLGRARLAVLGTIAAGQTGRLSDRGETAVHALSGGYQLAFVVAAGCVAVALLMAALFIQGPNARGAHDAEGDGSGAPA